MDKKKVLLLVAAVCTCFSLFAQEGNTGNMLYEKFSDKSGKTESFPTFDINFLLRSSLNFSNTISNEEASHLRLDESRFELLGDINERVSFRFRYRMNRSHAHTDLDNAPGSLDIASLQYKFGKDNKWQLTVGKQAAEVGSWEFEMNPTYEYQYTEYVNNILNLFLVAAKLGYEFLPDQTLSLQVHNTYNRSFTSAFAASGYQVNGLTPSSTPVGLYASWRGGFAENKFRTFYTFNISEYAEGKVNRAVSLGNKLVLPRFHAYLDLQTTYQAIDFTNIVSPFYNAVEGLPGNSMFYASNVHYNTAVLRLDYEFIPKWYITTKAWYESASMQNYVNLGSNFRNKFGYWAGLEYKPIDNQNLRFFANYFSVNTYLNGHAENIQPASPSHEGMFSVGFLYFINAL